MSQALRNNGLRVEPYVTGASSRVEGSPIIFTEASAAPTTGRNAMGLGQAIVVLCELRGIRLADQHFQRRTASSLIMLEAMLQIAHDNAETVISTIDSAVEDFINSDAEIVLTALEFRLLATFMARRGRVQSREALLTDVWGMSPDLTSRTVDTHVKRLREKLGDAGAYIETLRGVGYRFREDPDVADDASA